MEANDEPTKSFVPLTKGTEVGQYRIIDKIGSGGMGAQSSMILNSQKVSSLSAASYHLQIELITQGKGETIENSRRLLYIQNPERTNRIIETFIGDISAQIVCNQEEYRV